MSPTTPRELVLLRLQAGFSSQERMAEYLGVTRVTVCRWERGRRQPPASLALLLRNLISQSAPSPTQPQKGPRP